MLSVTAMWILGLGIILLPIVLSLVLNGTQQSDSRGRRINRTWQGRSLR